MDKFYVMPPTEKSIMLIARGKTRPRFDHRKIAFVVNTLTVRPAKMSFLSAYDDKGAL